MTRETTACSEVHSSRPAAWWAVAVCLTVVLGVRSAGAQVFRPDDPIGVDPDRLDMPAPEPREISEYFNAWIHIVGDPGSYEGKAANVNTLGDVPSSSWYEPRHYWHRMTPEELRRGPNEGDGPDAAGTWHVTRAQLDEETVRIEMVDVRGDAYVLTLDPMGHIELVSGAAFISARLLHAMGYNVPESFIVRFPRERLRPSPDAVLDAAGGRDALTARSLDALLVHAARYDDGTFRGLARSMPDGETVGPFQYYGTRPDDGNDIIPHEARRELRGLRVAASWINWTRVSSHTTLDVVVREEGREFVRHYLSNLGGTLGAGPGGPKHRWEGFEYLVDGSAILKRTATLGAVGSEWATIDYTDYPALGRIEAEHFRPQRWRPVYPNPAFRRLDAADAFWAAKQIASFSDDDLRAVIGSADYSDAAVVERLTDVLRARRDRISQAFLPYGGGIDRFDVQSGFLTFVDLTVRHGLVRGDRLRHVIWRSFDNISGMDGRILVADQIRGPRLVVPPSDSDMLVAEIRTPGGGSTRVYLRTEGGEREVVGVERRGASEGMP
ncbi:MAG: hypothetical protein WD021_08445 [Rhodothermales bacterium]